eukprot:gene20212-24196_t
MANMSAQRPWVPPYSLMRLFEYDNELVLSPISDDTEPHTSISDKVDPTCVIDRVRGTMALKSDFKLPPLSLNPGVIILGVLGILEGLAGSYLYVITGHELMGILHGAKVYRLTSIRAFEVKNFTAKEKQSTAYQDDQLLLGMVNEVLSSPHLYFSYGCTLTTSSQMMPQTSKIDTLVGEACRRQPSRSRLRKLLWEAEDQNFVWNYHFASPLIAAGLHSFEPALETSEPALDTSEPALDTSEPALDTSEPALDTSEPGDVANEVHSEQIAIVRPLAGCGLKATGCSVALVRGSIPIYWQTPPSATQWKPTLQLVPGRDATEPFARHFRRLHEKYTGSVSCVNLIDQDGKEAPLYHAFHEHMDKLNKSDPGIANLTSFDFHHGCGNSSATYARGLATLLKQVDRYLLEQGVYTYEPWWTGGKPQVEAGHSKQLGVFRVNCVDCLDRTNVVLGFLARTALERYLQRIGVLRPAETLELNK